MSYGYTDRYQGGIYIMNSILDLLQKSFVVEFEVVNCRDQVETQSKSFPTVTIPLTQNAKDFQLAKYMFNHNSFSCQTPIALFFAFR